MHGQQSEGLQRHRPMVPFRLHAAIDGSSHSKFFLKDDRKIRVGDCALFEAGNAPPLIGLIRRLTADKDRKVNLSVNWLYRAGDIKLGKGVALEAAPNEVFYSFHRDDILSDSLLHPCKIAFLEKGVELPAGVSSFVCRRVYDQKAKRLWWLTELGYRDEQQEELDKLLYKTRLEMHAAVQSTGTSKESGGTTSHLKTSSDGLQNTLSPSLAKVKKRERADQITDSVKRGLLKSDARDPNHVRREIIARSEEIAKITSKDGSLVNIEAVARLIHLMHLDKAEDIRKGIDLALWRTELVGVLAMTEREDCLSQFVQLQGLRILDDWLQEAHKGKSGDPGSPKESDKVMEDLLLMLLRALDRLPVDLDALKTYNVGKSVNNLKSHKNQEIHKKARLLVDTWKKRVDAEMKNNDSKSGSVQSIASTCKQGATEGVQIQGSRRAEETKDSLPINSSSKDVSSRSTQPETLARPISVAVATGKHSALHSCTVSSKDSHSKHAMSSIDDLPIASSKEDKNSSSQAQSNNQLWSSEMQKAAGSVGREDARNPPGSPMAAKDSGSGLRHRKFNNGIVNSGNIGTQKEEGEEKMTEGYKAVSDETIQCNQASDKIIGATGNYQLIVELPKPVQSSAPNGGSNEKMAVVTSTGTCRTTSTEVHVEPLQNNEAGFGDPSSKAILSEERNMVGEEIEKSEISNPPYLYADNGKQQENGSAALEAEGSAEEVDILLTKSKRSCAEVSNVETIAALGGGGTTSLASRATTETLNKDKILAEKYSTLGEGEGEESSVECSVDVTHSNAVKNPEDDIACVHEERQHPASKHDQHVSLDKESQKMRKAEFPCSQQHVSETLKFMHQPSVHVPCANNSVGSSGKSYCTDDKLKCFEEQHATEESTAAQEKPLEETEEMVFGLEEATCASLKSELDVADNNHRNIKEQDTERSEKANIVRRSDLTADEDGSKCDLKENSMNDQKKLEEHKDGLVPSVQDAHIVCNLLTKESIKDGGEDISLVSHSGIHSEADKKDIKSKVEDNRQSSKMPSDYGLENIGRGLHRTDIGNAYKGAVESFDNSKEVTNENQHEVDGEAVYIQLKSSSGHSDILSGSKFDLDKSGRPTCNDKPGQMHSTETNDPAVLKTLFPVTAEHAEKSDRATSTVLHQLEEMEKVTESANDVQAGEISGKSSEPKSTTQVVALSNAFFRLDFDLNKGPSTDETHQDDALISTTQLLPAASDDTNRFSSSGLNMSNAVTTKSRSPLLPLANRGCCSEEPPQKGTAAASAFCPAEPLRTPEKQHAAPECLLLHAMPKPVSCARNANQHRCPLDIDLNLPDGGSIDTASLNYTSHVSAGMESSEPPSHASVHSRRNASEPNGSTSTGRLELDLNRCDEFEDSPQVSSYKEATHFSLKMFPNGLSMDNSQTPKSFDLNDGILEDSAAEHSSLIADVKGKRSSHITSTSGWTINADTLNDSALLPPCASNSGITIHPRGLDRLNRSYPVVAASVAHSSILGSSAGLAYSADSHKGPVLTSNIVPTIGYGNVAQPTFPYGGFSFSPTLQLRSTFSSGASSHKEPHGTYYPTATTQSISRGAVSAAGVRPSVMGVTEITPLEGSSEWTRPVLDLNSGPGTVFVEARDTKQTMIAENCVLSENQLKAFNQVATLGILPQKRKEPEEGRDSLSVRFSQAPWK
eukprot:TRINITY_DN2109_c1_g4_i1.p1 TRINITY_DN2109_c1_g4~~TRINITY_DN2109_c1_g4_i1.p1  ORF type:complete len:1674 (+),score=411.28 TRINITY_DN2109_c1_g4_i1:207-5228(+)